MPLRSAKCYLRGPDIARHCAYQHMSQQRRVEVPGAARQRFGGVVPEACRVIDRMLGELLERMRPEDSIIVLSDHGWGYREKRGTYGHARG